MQKESAEIVQFQYQQRDVQTSEYSLEDDSVFSIPTWKEQAIMRKQMK